MNVKPVSDGTYINATLQAEIVVNIAAAVVISMSVAGIIATIVGRFAGTHSLATFAFWLQIFTQGTTTIAIAITLPIGYGALGKSRSVAEEAIESKKQVTNLFEMTDMLQSAISQMDANSVLISTTGRLLAEFGGALYVLNNSRDRLDLSTTWNWPEDRPPTDAISPSNCWALKRGKAHINGVGRGLLRCEHHTAEIAVLEIPMMARGEVYGLLKLQTSSPDPEAKLAEVEPLASAIADAMSMSLSNISLREKLRTQALRDPLTGLYNRRYMEDMLERFYNLAERNGGAVSAIMIDLDHFKLLNDEHGHAMGDAVLREVAAALSGALRKSDVACRYGGEELVVLLPDCDLAEAVSKAEVLRARVESLSQIHGMPITASFGVATVPDTAAEIRDLVPSADAALYRAKQSGRNLVVGAERRAKSLDTAPILVAAE